jgi:ubiquitin-conjugating enzyme E2 variant
MQAAAAVLAADFISGAVHWAEDAYARPDTPIIGKLIANANIEHHAKPRAFVTRGWLESSWDLLLLGTAVIATAWWLDMLAWPVWLFVFCAVNANQVHKWAHSNPRENGAIVSFLQKIKLLQTQRHHGKHHSGMKDSHYCALTNVLNPVLDELGFWRGLERGIERLFGMQRRPDPTVHVKGQLVVA